MKPAAVILLTLALVACSGGEEEAGGVAAGRELFESTVLAGQPGCITCHSRAAGEVLVGPSLAGISGTAASRIPGTSAREFLRESIRDPDAFVVDGFEPGRMPNWGELLDEGQVDALVDYLLTVEG